MASIFQRPYAAEAKAPPAFDEHIQNLVFQEDTVINDSSVTTRIFDIQGAGHRSPLENQQVTAVPGIVSLVRNNGFFFQDAQGDGNDATSDGIFVFTSTSPTVRVGDAVKVSGIVTEFRPASSPRNLSTTQIGTGGNPATFAIKSHNNPLPTPVIIGLEGRTPPTEQMAGNAPSGTVEAADYVFDPEQNGIDFYESLEGMQVQVNGGVVVGPTNNFGEVWILADNGVGATGRTPRDGIVISPDDFNPERIQVQFPSSSAPKVNVSDRLSSVIGVMTYDFGNFEVLPTNEITPTSSGLEREITELVTGGEKLTVASYNIENFSPVSPSTQITNIASHIAVNLDGPDIVALQEVQDNTGPANDGVVDASQSYQVLADAIVAAGGPTYKFFDIAPVNNQDGGAPGGNIRVGYLYNPDRVSFVNRPGGSATTDTTVIDGGLSTSPGRLQPDNPAFTASRKPLAAEFVFNGQRVFLINNHFSSKGGSDSLFGAFQPPLNSRQDERAEQARVNRQLAEELLAANPNARIAVMGDLNEFQFFPPLQALETSETGEQVLFNLTNLLPEDDRYSYIFEGNSQALDHIAVSQKLLEIAEYDGVHLNAEFFDQDSDHDPRLARFDLTNPTPTLGSTNVVIGSNQDDEIAARGGQRIFAQDGNDIVSPTPSSPGGNFIDGGNGNDLLIASQNDVLEGGNGNDYLSAADGHGNNVLNGGAGDDLLFGGINDVLNGGDGNDVLYAGRGGNTLFGGSGCDQFWIGFNTLPECVNVVVDFDPCEDVIGFRNVPGVESFADLTLIQLGADTLIQAMGRDIARFQGVHTGQITSDRVVFA